MAARRLCLMLLAFVVLAAAGLSGCPAKNKDTAADKDKKAPAAKGLTTRAEPEAPVAEPGGEKDPDPGSEQPDEEEPGDEEPSEEEPVAEGEPAAPEAAPESGAAEQGESPETFRALCNRLLREMKSDNADALDLRDMEQLGKLAERKFAKKEKEQGRAVQEIMDECEGLSRSERNNCYYNLISQQVQPGKQ